MTDNPDTFYANPAQMAHDAQEFPQIANAAQEIGYGANSAVQAGVPAFGTDPAGMTFTKQVLAGVTGSADMLQALSAVCQQTGPDVEATASAFQAVENNNTDLAGNLAQITDGAIQGGTIRG